MEAPWTLALAQKRLPDRETKHQKIPGGVELQREGEVETQERQRYPLQATPPGADRDLGTGQWRKRGGELMQETTVDSGT